MVWGTTHELAQPSGEHGGGYAGNHGGDHAGDHGGDHGGHYVGDHVGDQVGDHVGDHVCDHVSDHFRDHASDHAGEHGFGGDVNNEYVVGDFYSGDDVDFVMIVIKFLRQQTRDRSTCWQVFLHYNNFVE